jgi:hypothetical protein
LGKINLVDFSVGGGGVSSDHPMHFQKEDDALPSAGTMNLIGERILETVATNIAPN